jgi:uncharacterized membrane protein
MNGLAAPMFARTWLALLWLVWSPPAQDDSPVVRAVLFYSPSCGHCYQVITQDLPPLFELYGERLDIVGVDTSVSEGHQMYQAAADRFGLPAGRRGVPMLIIGDVILVGSEEIPDQLPGLIEAHLARGGLDWPDLPGLEEVLRSIAAEATATPETGRTSEPEPTTMAEASVAGVDLEDAGDQNTGVPNVDLLAKLSADPWGSALSIGILIVMVGMVGWVGWRACQGRVHPAPIRGRRGRMILGLCLTGLAVAGYLAFVEVTRVEAVCGPIGDCNTVQSSRYASLFGLLPIGAVGLLGYVLVGIVWWVGAYGGGRPGRVAPSALLGMTFAGTLFSIYLTFLEPFVIGATCLWCLTSAAVMASLFFLAATGGDTARRRPHRLAKAAKETW